MPIRTNRGRAAVYRRLWGWPLRSPKHLVTTLVVLAVVITALGIVLPKTLGKHAGPTPVDAFGPDPTSSSSSREPLGVPITSTTSPLPTRLSSPLSTPTSAAPNAESLQVAKQWATAWVTHPAGITNQQWRDGLSRFTTEEYLPQLSTVDPGNIPASKVTGEPTVVNSFTSSLEVEIPTDGPKLSITVVSTTAGWRVTHYGQAN
jgi:hypothetical protein